jgi:hypothetical protein
MREAHHDDKGVQCYLLTVNADSKESIALVWSRLTRNRLEVSLKSNLKDFVDSQVKELKNGEGVG